LQQEVAQLWEQVNKDSQNSSKPPPSDPPLVKRKSPVAKGEHKHGGQPVHEGNRWELKPPEQVSRPHIHAHCGTQLMG